MATNNFKPFAVGSGANVTSQSDYENLISLQTGFQSGKASSAQINKALRQSTFVASALAQYIMNKVAADVLDNGDVAGFITQMSSAFSKDFQKLDATLTALAALATGANKLPYFTGTDTAAQTDLTSVGRDILAKTAAADVLSYLSGAPLASPTFTGDPKAPTPSSTDNDTSIATTAFVQSVIGTLSLGSASRRDVGTGPANNLIPDMGSFIRSLASNGYQNIPGGLLIQWGTASISGSGTTATVNFPIPFPTSTFQILMCDTGGATTTYGTTNRTTSSFTAVRNITSGNTVGFYFALGN